MAFVKQKNKGCVYFFKQNNSTAIKIGLTTSPTPTQRFNDLLTFSPYGAEIVGIISTFNPRKIESELHTKFSKYRLRGEWFEINKDDVNSCISAFKGTEDAPIVFSEKRTSKKRIDNTKAIVEAYKKDSGFNRSALALELGISRQTIFRVLIKK